MIFKEHPGGRSAGNYYLSNQASCSGINIEEIGVHICRVKLIIFLMERCNTKCGFFE